MYLASVMYQGTGESIETPLYILLKIVWGRKGKDKKSSTDVINIQHIYFPFTSEAKGSPNKT